MDQAFICKGGMANCNIFWRKFYFFSFKKISFCVFEGDLIVLLHIILEIPKTGSPSGVGLVMNYSDGNSRNYKKSFFIVIVWIKFMVSINKWVKKLCKITQEEQHRISPVLVWKNVICSFLNKLKSTSGVRLGFYHLIEAECLLNSARG